jgi:hypothetical protein
VFGGPVSHVRFIVLGLAITAVSPCQPPPSSGFNTVMSNREARKAATTVHEATVPPGFSPTEFTVRISVGADGNVKNVSNPHSLPEPLFAAAEEAARQWHFLADHDRRMRGGFEAEISFHGPIAGTAMAKDGTPVAGVLVVGSEWTCCPVQHDSMKTDTSGTFHIEHPGAVLHFFPDESLQPQSLVVTPEMSAIKVSLDAAITPISLASCRKPQAGFERISMGRYGLQFDVLRRDVVIKRGKVDVDYVVHIVRAKHGDDRVEFWFGPNAMDSVPEDEQYVESEVFATRTVVMPPGIIRGSEGGRIGLDTVGHLPDGKMWRQMAVLAKGGARYQDISPENAALFDRIINSACLIPYPEH